MFKRSYDARKKSAELSFVYTVDCELRDEASVLAKFKDDAHVRHEHCYGGCLTMCSISIVMSDDIIIIIGLFAGPARAA